MEGKVRVPVEAGWILAFDDAGSHAGTQGLAAIQTERFDHDRLSGEEPANCWRLKRSLGEPFLLVVDADAVQVRKIAEGSEAPNEIGVGEEEIR